MSSLIIQVMLDLYLYYQFANIMVKGIINNNSFMIEKPRPIKQLFTDVNYAWELLQAQIKFQMFSNCISGEDVSYMLQLYMRGVERMNSMTDIRQSYFKNKVTSLMSRPVVMKILNKPMSKKSQAPVVQSQPFKPIIDNKIQIQLQQKRIQMEMRLAYGAQQHNPDHLKKMMAQHTLKQSILTNKIQKIVGDHEQRLMNRVKQRKLRTMTARSQRYKNQNQISQEQMIMKRDEQQFGKTLLKEVKKRQQRRKVKSMSHMKIQFEIEVQAPVRRRVSMDFGIKNQ